MNKLFWSEITIPGEPKVMFIDACQNVQGWETDFGDRTAKVLMRKDTKLLEDRVIRINNRSEILPKLLEKDSFNTIFLLCHEGESGISQELQLKNLWDWIVKSAQLPPKLFVACTCDYVEAKVSESILENKDTFSQLALVPQLQLPIRSAGLFFMKFFSELQLHAEESITGKMVWFSHSKAREILRRRNLSGKVGLKC